MKKIHWFTIEKFENKPRTGEPFNIEDEDIKKQIFKVLKLKVGEQVVLKIRDTAFTAYLHTVSRDVVEMRIEEEIKKGSDSKKIHLFFCIPKKDNFEFILEKGTELGVTDFHPLISDRTIKTNINIERSAKIIKEASEQAQRVDTPTLHGITLLKESLAEYSPIVFDVEGEMFKKQDARNSAESIALLIGPEGGFSEQELRMFTDTNLSVYKLGNTVLKTETATIVAVTLLTLA